MRRLKPDVLLLDLGLPRMSGIDVTREVKKKQPKVEILIFTIFDEEDKVLEAVQAGASGYLLKDRALEELIPAICTVIDNRTQTCPDTAGAAVKEYL